MQGAARFINNKFMQYRLSVNHHFRYLVANDNNIDAVRNRYADK